MVARRDWFTIVATDLFAGCFAAVVIIDSVTPKEIAAAPQPMLFEMSYPAKTSKVPCGANKAAVALSFQDDSKRLDTINNGNFTGSRRGNMCVVTGVFQDVELSSPPSDARVLLVENDPDPAAQFGFGEIEIDFNEYNCKCDSTGACSCD